MTTIRLLLIAAGFVSAMLTAHGRISVQDLDAFIFGDSLTIAGNARQKADSLQLIRMHTPPSAQRVEATRQLGDYFLERQTDSAFIYWYIALNEAQSLGLDDKAMLIRMRVDGCMPFIGMGAEGVTDFKEIDPSGFNDELKRAYYLASCELHYNLAMKYPESQHKNRNIAQTVESIDSLLPFYAPESPVYRYLFAFRSILTGNKSVAAATIAELLPELRERPALYVKAANILADFYEHNPNRREEYLNYLLEAAVASLKNGVVRPSIMARLGKELCNEGDYKRGTRCIYLAFKSNDFERGLYQLPRTGDYAPLLTRRDNSIVIWLSILAALAVLAAVVFGTMLISHRRKTKVTDEKTRAEIKRLTEEIIRLRNERRDYLSLAFSTLERFKDFNRYIHRKLTAGQAKDLFKEVESGVPAQTQADKFFEEFDALFLKSGAGFLERLNTLLQPGQQLSLLPDNKMPPEIRIAALMSLGITDSPRIASVLGLSLNTVYTYRNRLKGRALDRAEFENQLRDICEFA